MTMLALFESAAPEVGCRTCGGEAAIKKPPATQSSFCSYWCDLVQHGPAFYTLQTITPWLRANRPPNARIAND